MKTAEKSNYLIEPLDEQHDRAAFSCGIEALDNYFRKQAGQDQKKLVAAVFVLVDATKLPIGFYTLSSTSVNLRDLPADVAKKLPKYPVVPGTLLGRLAVSKEHTGKKLGEFLLVDALKRSLEHSKEIASAAIIVDAKNEAVKTFYLKFGFIQFPDQPSRLFIPMKTIAKLFSALR